MKYIIAFQQGSKAMLIKNDFRYPAMLNLTGKRCVVVGGGAVAARKLASLCEAAADVEVVAPEFFGELQETARRYGCRLLRAAYAPEYIRGAFVVVAATDDATVNRQITADAPCLCNNITEPELSNFIVPSSFRQGNITVAVTTGGMPAFTRRLKNLLRQTVTPELADFNDFLRRQRALVRQIPSTPEERTEFWRRALNEEILNLVTAGQAELAKEKIVNAISGFRTQSQNGSRGNTRTF